MLPMPPILVQELRSISWRFHGQPCGLLEKVFQALSRQSISGLARSMTSMLLTIVSKGAISCNVDIILLAVGNQIVLWKERVRLDLIHDL